MAMVESIQRAIAFIENNILEDLSIGKIAQEANFSSFHFQRAFALLTDVSVGEYIRRRRLSLAAQDLLSTDDKIIDIAFKYGYDTPEAFTKAFRRQHGTSPSDVRRFEGKLQTYNRLVIQVTLKGAEPMKYSVVNKDAFRVVGVKRTYSLGNGENMAEIPKLWQEVNENGITEKLVDMNNGLIKGILGVCGATTEEMRTKNLMDYWVAAASSEDPPEGMEELEIPATKWAVFEVHGAMPHAMQDKWKQIFSEWFPSNSYEHAGTPDFEWYGDGNPNSEDYYSEIWIPVK
ncbi:Regulatory protein SoxS [Bacillus sp. THAF10]|uniref:AraC family transcriptional regulator n=1 Tax=Bacillus sp. THAF10 TaxID=2587848 RepID=UPI0012697C4B|nr:AraC family transcriptional regulator [Bacillus sp. THAF10]QFT89780.1 Regulatory protein SoxS [Bacillus sp. THAF10]